MRRVAASVALVLTLACREQAREVAPIRLDPMTTIGADTGAGMLVTWPRVSPHHPLGYRILVPQSGGARTLPAVFDDGGAFLGILGGSGEAPGEFREPLFVRFGPGDSVYVFDGAQRVLIFSPERVYARTVALPITPWDAVVMADGRMVIASSVYEHPLPLLLVEADGRIAMEMGASDSASMATASPRRVVLGPDGTVWTMPMTGGWRLEHWGPDGTLIAAVSRTPAWYPAPSIAGDADGATAPKPSVQDAWFDDAGRLWILGKAVDPTWKKGVEDANSATNVAPAIEEPDKVGDTIVEVFDVSIGAVVAEARFDAVYPFAVEPGIVMRVVRGEGTALRAELARLVFDADKLQARAP